MTPAGPLTVAAAQPPCVARDVAANASAHADAVRAARARLVVFPGLSLTGYELDADPVDPADPALAPLVEACAASGAVTLAGAPVEGEDGRLHIAMLRVDGTGAAVAYRKAHPGGDETARFSPGPGPCALDLDGRRVGLMVCRDTRIAGHVEGTAALGVDLVVAGVVHHDHELAAQEERALRIARGSATARARSGSP